MAEAPNPQNATRKKWEGGQQCEIYSILRKCWIKGEVINTFTDEEGEWVKVKYGRIVHDIPAKDQDIRKVAYKVKWHNLKDAVSQELYPMIATTLGQSVDELVAAGKLKQDDLSGDATDEVIEVMKEKKVLYNNEIEYIKGLVKRAEAYRWDETENSKSTVALKPLTDDDLSEKFPGLTANLLLDIYSVHKALMFGQFNLKKYSKNDFMDNTRDAENRVFEEPVCSPIIKAHESDFNVSFHPFYVINDNIFEVMAFHFAVSSFANQLDRKEGSYRDLNIRSFVIPSSVTSIYDPETMYKSSIEDVPYFLNSISTSNHHILLRIESNLDDIESVSNVLFKMYKRIASDDPRNIVIVLNRRREINTIRLFECKDSTKLIELYMNYFLGFELNVNWEPVPDAKELECTRRLVRCWMTYGMNQRLRFYPESLLWIVPRLFTRNVKMSARAMMKKLYHAEYKWGWRVNLDDPAFNHFYHIITKYEHITNNYNRREMSSSLKNDDEFGLRDNLNHKLHRNSSVLLNRFVEEHAFDSDAILEDSLSAKRVDDEKNSNIFHYLNALGLKLTFRELRNILLRHRGIVCCSETVSSNEECPWIEDLVADLLRLKECNLEIDASNFWYFDLDSIVPSWRHVLSVHGLMSEDVDREQSRQKIRNYILQRVRCEEGTNCKALGAQEERRREKKREERVEVAPDVVTAECEAVEEAVFGIHCQIFHGQNEQKRSAPSDDEPATESRFKGIVPTATTATEAKEDGSEPVAIDFGRSVLRWLSPDDSPRFDTLRNELILHPHSTIDLVMYDRLRKWAVANDKQSDSTVNESLGLKAYSDTNDFQAALSRAHWESASQDDRRSFYRWAMTLYRVHLRSAVPIPPATASSTKPRPLYTGMSILLSLSHELEAYYGPLSTTTSKSVASGFSGGTGQIYKYGSSYVNPLRCTVGIDMQSISCYPQEQEIMLYHTTVPIQSTTTQSEDSSALVDHLLYSLQSRTNPIVRPQAFYNKLGIKWTSSWIPLILSHKLLFKKTKCGGMTVIDRLGKELDISFFEMMRLLRAAMIVDDVCILRLRKSSKISLKLLCQFEFRACFTESEYAAVNAESFEFPCDSLMGTVSEFLGLCIFAKAKTENSKFEKIDYLTMNRYELKKESPLHLKETINVCPRDLDHGVDGNFVLKSLSDIIVGTGGAVITDDVERDSAMKGKVGITLVSESAIRNNGILRCKLMNGQQRGDRSMHLMAPTISNHGAIQCDSSNDSIRIICNHFENVGTISPEPVVVITEHPDAHLMEYLMLRLLWSSTPITDKEQFYRNIGVQWNSSWIPYIVQHPNLLHPTKCNDMTLIERLAVELKIRIFEELLLIRSAMFVDNESTLRLKNSEKISDELISKFVFAVSFGGEMRRAIPPTSIDNFNRNDDWFQLQLQDLQLQERPQPRTIQPESVLAFKLQCGPLTKSIADSLKMNVFCRAKDDSFDFVKIHSLFLNQYDFQRKEPLIISESIAVHPFDPDVGAGGSVTIKSSSNIAIIDDGSITTDSLMSKRPDVESRVGFILLSESSIINEGVLRCKTLIGQQRGARSMYLIARSVINHGVIRCDCDNDEIVIFCTEFENTGNIAVGKGKNDRVCVEIMSTESFAEVLNLMDSKRASEMSGKRGEKQMKLEYEKHSGHYSARWTSCHPRNLLEEGTGKGYISANVGAVGEWMIFRLQSEERVFPTKIGIWNEDRLSGLKSMSISGSADNEQFEEWTVIENIKKNSELQIFHIDPMDGLVARSGRFKFFRIEMESYSRYCNAAFYDFRIYGIVTD